jgi:hypothetical protein
MSNLNFTGVRNDQHFTSVSVGRLNVENVNERNGVHRVVGYAPVSFATLAATGVVPLMNAPGQTAQSTFAAGAVRVPYGAVILRAIVTNNGTEIVGDPTTTFDLGFGAASNTTSDQLLDSHTIDSVNGGLVLTPTAAVFSTAAVTNLLQVETTSGGDPVDAFLTVTALVEPLTEGDLRVVLEYMLV